MVLDLLERHRCVAIVRLDDLTHGVSIVNALLRAGIRLIEFTLTNPDATKVVSDARKIIREFNFGNSAIGIGSVRTLDQAMMAIDAGAQFVVSPITSPAVIAHCQQSKVPVMPGALTPTEIATAWEFGADVVKVFPARGLGPAYIRDVLAPMPYLKLMPTGGIDLGNVRDYFEAGAVGVGIGGQLLDQAAIGRCDWESLECRARPYAIATSRESTS